MKWLDSKLHAIKHDPTPTQETKFNQLVNLTCDEVILLSAIICSYMLSINYLALA